MNVISKCLFILPDLLNPHDAAFLHSKLSADHHSYMLDGGKFYQIKSNQIKSTLFHQGSHVSSEELVSMRACEL